MTPAYTARLSFSIWKIYIEAQKIDSSTLETYDMVMARFSFQDSLEKIRFFEKIFLLTDTSIEVFLEIFFLFLSNTNI